MTGDARCPRCHRLLVDEVELVAGDPPVTAWWCTPCAMVVRRDAALHLPIPRQRADVDA